jgi:hypothetical protein
MRTISDNEPLKMYVTIHHDDHPQLHTFLSAFKNKQIRSRQFKKLAEDSLLVLSGKKLITNPQISQAINVTEVQTTRTGLMQHDKSDEYPPIQQNLAESGFSLG